MTLISLYAESVQEPATDKSLANQYFLQKSGVGTKQNSMADVLKRDN